MEACGERSCNRSPPAALEPSVQATEPAMKLGEQRIIDERGGERLRLERVEHGWRLFVDGQAAAAPAGLHDDVSFISPAEPQVREWLEARGWYSDHRLAVLGALTQDH